MKQATLERWFAGTTRRHEAAAASTAIALFDNFGTSLYPFAQLGYNCKSYILKSEQPVAKRTAGVEFVHLHRGDATEVRDAIGRQNNAFIFAIPPCKNLCLAGARWWKRKRLRNSQFQSKELAFLEALCVAVEESGAPAALLTPTNSQIPRALNRRFVRVSPHEFGGYLSKDAEHPTNSFLPPQDGYTKSGLLLLRGGLSMPWKKPVKPIFKRVTLRNGARNMSPVMAARAPSAARALAPLGLCTALAAQFAQ